MNNKNKYEKYEKYGYCDEFDENLSYRVKNPKQARFYMDNGCIAKVWDRYFDAEYEKQIWYLQFLLNDTFYIAEKKWREWDTDNK